MRQPLSKPRAVLATPQHKQGSFRIDLIPCADAHFRNVGRAQPTGVFVLGRGHTPVVSPAPSAVQSQHTADTFLRVPGAGRTANTSQGDRAFDGYALRPCSDDMDRKTDLGNPNRIADLPPASWNRSIHNSRSLSVSCARVFDRRYSRRRTFYLGCPSSHTFHITPVPACVDSRSDTSRSPAFPARMPPSPKETPQ